ncbi:hypothetical protein EBU71_22660 [bacterium]|nr:hypothetical protein [Candidatus Elulimicrobium humile]
MEIIYFILVLYSILLPIPFGALCIIYTIQYNPNNKSQLLAMGGIISDNLGTDGGQFNWITDIIVTISYILGFRYLYKIKKQKI